MGFRPFPHLSAEMVVKWSSKKTVESSIRLQGGRERCHWTNQPQTVGREPTKSGTRLVYRAATSALMAVDDQRNVDRGANQRA